jgi:hydrogenase nickel incorporation protein HypA/HybF
MHEVGIANAVIDAARQEAERRPGSRLMRVGVRIGELAAVDPEALRFCFDALTRGTDLEQLVLEIQPSPRRHRCEPCRREFQVVAYEFACPECGRQDTLFVSGDELELAYVELEEV